MLAAHDSRRALETIRAASWLLVAATGLLGVLRFAFEGPSSIRGLTAFGVCLLASLGPVLIRYLPRPRLAGYWPPTVGLGALTFVGVSDAGIYSDSIVWLAVLPVVGSFLLGRTAALTFGVLSLAAALVICLFGPVPPDEAAWLKLGSLVASISFVSGVAYAYESHVAGRNAALHKTMDRLDGLIAAIPHDLLRLDQNEGILDHVMRNPDVITPLGANLGDVLPMHLATEIHELRSAARASDSLKANTVDVDARLIEVQVVPLDRGESLVLMQDVSARNELETLKADFVSVVSHELRTPLTAVIASLGLVNGGVYGPISKGMSDVMQLASRNADQLARLIEDLLDMRKLDAADTQLLLLDLDAAEIVEVAVVLHAPFAAQYGVVVTVTPLANELQFVGDRQRVLQVFSNLLSNATKHAGEEKRVEISARRGDASVEFRVTDFGDGITDEFKDHVFERFSQAKRDAPGTKGTGLGLAIAHQLVTILGGSIGFDTELGQGTTFWFRLPEPTTNRP